MGLTCKVKEVEKLTVLLQCTPGTEPHSMEGYGNGDVYKNIGEGRNTTATCQSQFFPPLRIVMVGAGSSTSIYARRDITSNLAVAN